MLSLMIVPYESTVVFIDQRMQEKLPSEDFSQCLLSYQEKQHSAVHFQMNRLQPRKSQLDTVYSWIGKKLTRLLMNVPPILEGMIAYVQKRSVFVRLWFVSLCVLPRKTRALRWAVGVCAPFPHLHLHRRSYALADVCLPSASLR